MTQRPRDESEDPFEGLVLDEDFVLAARKREPSADDRLSRAAALRTNLEHRERQQRIDRRPHRRLWRRIHRPSKRPGLRIVVTLIVLVLVSALVWWESNHRDSPTWAGGDPLMQLLDDQNRPTPSKAASDVPLGIPDPEPTDRGPHAFMATQTDGTTPVAYDPCRPIPVVINERTMPSAATGLVAEAIDEVSSITGLRFVVEGPTDEGAAMQRQAYQPDRYGDRWAPVLVAWTDPVEQPELDGNVAGLGGSSAVETADSGRVYVSGLVLLDGPGIEPLLEHPEGRALAKAIVLHELGHLVGLDHVHDPGQLMNAENEGQTEFANGDLTGLYALSRGACIDQL